MSGAMLLLLAFYLFASVYALTYACRILFTQDLEKALVLLKPTKIWTGLSVGAGWLCIIARSFLWF